MERNDIFNLIHLDDHSATPKYQQLANSVINAIASGRLGKDFMMPSINELSFEFQISRDTAEKGYKHLKSIGVLGCVIGIIICGRAGMMKEKDLPEKEKKKSIAEFSLVKGLIVATVSGILSACFNFGIDAGTTLCRR